MVLPGETPSDVEGTTLETKARVGVRALEIYEEMAEAMVRQLADASPDSEIVFRRIQPDVPVGHSEWHRAAMLKADVDGTNNVSQLTKQDEITIQRKGIAEVSLRGEKYKREIGFLAEKGSERNRYPVARFSLGGDVEIGLKPLPAEAP